MSEVADARSRPARVRWQSTPAASLCSVWTDTLANTLADFVLAKNVSIDLFTHDDE